MQFEPRDLKPYAEPVLGSNLKLGSVYFYVDDEMLMPTVEPLIFIGENLDVNDVGRIVYFQDADSYRQGLRHDSDAKGCPIKLFAAPKNELQHILEYENAMEELISCALKRRKTRS